MLGKYDEENNVAYQTQDEKFLEPAVSRPVASLGQVISVRGSEAHIGLSDHHRGANRATVGRFMAITAGAKALIGMITEVSARRLDADSVRDHTAVARVALMGEIARGSDGKPYFKRGVSDYPAIGDPANNVSSEQLRLIYTPSGQRTINIGQLAHDSSIAAHIDVDNLISKHFAVLGSTGVGKSSGVTVILSEILKARPDIRIFLLDGHNEYGGSFGTSANVISPGNLKLPFWLFNFEELTDVIYGGRPAPADEIEILSELIPIAKSNYLQYKTSPDRVTLKKGDPTRTGYTVDTPVPYLLQDLLSLIDSRMGKLENRSSRMNYHRLMMRIETIKNDPRYAFMFENASVGGDIMAELLNTLFRLESDGKPISVMQLAGLPVEVIDAVVSLLGRLAFDFGLWSEGKMPLLFVCEEAHRYASADRSMSFAPSRRALSRMAKEGRKYGVFLGLVTQRPAELDPTIISQCSTLFAMRMANDHDQALLRSAVSDAAANLLDFVPTLGTGDVIGFGEGMPVPAQFSFLRLDEASLPRADAGLSSESNWEGVSRKEFVNAVVNRWRGNGKNDTGSVPAAPNAPIAAAPRPETGIRPEPAARPKSGAAINDLLDDARRQILKR